jgi:hypothetical protein
VRSLGPTNANLANLASDQVSSTSLAMDASGNLLSATRYLPYGAVRYQSGTLPTDKTFTGQRADFGLMDYQARFYDV